MLRKCTQRSRYKRSTPFDKSQHLLVFLLSTSLERPLLSSYAVRPPTNELVFLPQDVGLPEGFEELPDRLSHAARCVLQGEDRARISRISKGALSKYTARWRTRHSQQVHHHLPL